MSVEQFVIAVIVVVMVLLSLEGCWVLGKKITTFVFNRYVRKNTLTIRVKGTDGSVLETSVSVSDAMIDKLMGKESK